MSASHLLLRWSSRNIPFDNTSLPFLLPSSLHTLNRLPSHKFHLSQRRSMAAATGPTILRQPNVEKEAKHITNGNVKVNNWSQPGPAAFDFRSDIVTTPTTRMLEAIAATTLLDDVFQEDPTTLDLESFVANLTGKEGALLVLSGTMGNQVAIRTHLLSPPHSVVCDHRSHIFKYEAGGVSSLSGAMLITIEPSNGKYLTLEDVQKKAIISSDVHACPTKLISLENTLNGVIMPLSECQRISKWARENGMIMHCDGARLWEAVAAGAGSLKEYSQCFDSISLCFSKGLGAPIGSMIVGTKQFRERARWVRKSIGGGLRQAGVVTAAARVCVEDTFLGGKLEATHERAQHVAKLWESYGGKTSYPVETNMVWFDLDAAGISTESFVELGEKAGVRLNGGRAVVHYQIGDEGLQRLEKVMQAVFNDRALNGSVQYGAEKLQHPNPVR